MKRAVFFLLLLGFFALFPLPILALTYVDTMESTGGGVRVSTQSLASVFRSRSLEFNDRCQLQLVPGRDGRLRGGASYLAQGIEGVSLRIYTARGTYVTPMEGGALALGLDSGVFRPDPARVLPAYYHTGDGMLYAWKDGWQVFRGSYDRSFGEFTPAEEVDQSRLVPFGAALYATLESGSSVALPLSRTSIAFVEAEGQIFCTEDFACASIPANTTSLRVELNDLEGDLLSRDVRTSLAWVMLHGTSLTVGPSRPAIPQPGVDPSSSQSSSSQSASSKSSSSKSSSKSSASQASSKALGAASSAAGGSGKEAASASFPASSKANPWPAAPEESAGTEQASAASETAQPELPHYLNRESEPTVYRIELPAREQGVDVGAILYAALVGGMILYLLLRPKQK